MISTFVRRIAGSSNHSIARVAMDALLPTAPRAVPLAGLAADFRAGRVERHRGFRLSRPDEIASAPFDPCPSEDFNGVGFLYFTSFLGFVDRAEWRLDREAASVRTLRREVFYYGNIDPGETLRIVLLDRRRTSRSFRHRWRIERGEDGASLADVFTEKTVS